MSQVWNVSQVRKGGLPPPTSMARQPGVKPPFLTRKLRSREIEQEKLIQGPTAALLFAYWSVRGILRLPLQPL